MTRPKTEEYIFYQGEKFQVEFYFAEAGKLPAKEYLEKASLDVKIKLATLVQYIADAGQILDTRKFRLVVHRDINFSTFCHSCESRNLREWIPVFTGMTDLARCIETCVTVQ